MDPKRIDHDHDRSNAYPKLGFYRWLSNGEWIGRDHGLSHGIPLNQALSVGSNLLVSKESMFPGYSFNYPTSQLVREPILKKSMQLW